jgi:phosphoadenosine phosphosulfate reductase
LGFVLQEEEISSLAEEFRTAKPQEILKAALERVPNITFASSFGAEDMVLIDMLMQIDLQASVFYIDTDRLFPETYALIDRTVSKYGIPNLLHVKPELTLEEQAEKYGDELWLRNPDLCTNLRKVQPLIKTLSKFDGWITGIRRDQAPTRAHAETFELDTKFGLVKVNPLAFWTSEQVWDYIHVNQVLYNPLHDQGYPSIGCVHCTQPVKPGEDPRSGRWRGFEKTECGLHL